MSDVSVAQIRELQGQGLSNNQIIQSLQREGFRSSEIFDALNQVSIQPTQPGQGMPARPGPQALNNLPPEVSTMVQPMPRAPGMSPGVNEEELIETIIDEKWNDLLEDINRIVAWKERTQQRVDQFEQQLKDLKEQFDRLHQAVIGKVGEYDQHILQVGAEVKAMEKVFSKVLPAFTENVAELSRVADTMKKSTVKKK